LKIAITGKPGTGKTTLIKRIYRELSAKGIKISGFYTEEVRENRTRTGFDIVMLPSEKRLIFARKKEGAPRIGKYRVFVENIEKAIEFLQPASILIIDEIGKMELLNPSFREFIIKSLKEEKNILLTYGMGIERKIKELIERTCRVFILTPENREKLAFNILKNLEYL